MSIIHLAANLNTAYSLSVVIIMIISSIITTHLRKYYYIGDTLQIISLTCSIDLEIAIVVWYFYFR